MDCMKILMVIAFVGILGALLLAGVFMVRGKDSQADSNTAKSQSMMRALAIRVGISVGIFLLTLLAWLAGWIQPSGMPQ
jgi:uncharacterized metal-binding protein